MSIPSTSALSEDINVKIMFAPERATVYLSVFNAAGTLLPICSLTMEDVSAEDDLKRNGVGNEED